MMCEENIQGSMTFKSLCNQEKQSKSSTGTTNQHLLKNESTQPKIYNLSMGENFENKPLFEVEQIPNTLFGLKKYFKQALPQLGGRALVFNI